MISVRRLFIGLVGVALLSACRHDPKGTLAPAASSLDPGAPAPGGSSGFSVQASTSKLEFTMEAPVEKIYGEAPGAIEGTFTLDPHDLRKTRGLIRMDLGKLYLFQQKRSDESGAFGDKERNPKQNEHMKEWFGIDDATAPSEREKNRWAQFAVTELKDASATDADALGGPSRKITATIAGELLLHGRKAPKTLKIEATFLYAGAHIESIAVKSLEPLQIALKEHDIRPPDANTSEQVLQNWLGLFGKKVAEQAPVNFEFRAVPN